ncbi:MAG TPA: sigma-70 family RNA polymerase sigma factor [Candidatus Aquabacterium excrementipullorum]|nr:sigma-70 family RNA polymerase sigma factor [Candidatus Aquabacterium excrementipullorum]
MPATPLSSLETLYVDHHGWLKGWLRGKVGNGFDAADLAHDTFVRVLKASNAQDIRQPRDYLATIARGLVVDWYRHQAIERAFLDALACRADGLTLSLEERAIMLETLTEIDRMLDGLGERSRGIFLMAQLEGLGHAEIGQRMGVSVTTVKNHLVKAMTHCLLLVAE